MSRIEFAPGEVIFHQGDPSTHCYRILSGRVEIRVDVHGAMHRGRSAAIAVSGRGDMIGDMSMIDNAPRSATAVALEPTVCESYSADAFTRLLESEPDEAASYVRRLIHRVRDGNRKLARAAPRPG